MPRDSSDYRERDSRDASDVDYLRLWEQGEKKRQEDEERRRRAWYDWATKNERTEPYSAWLVIPYDFADWGARPLAPGTTFWESPYIWVESPDISGRPLAGAENHLVAQIFNLGGASAAPTKVDFYWADPSIGLGPGDAHFIGTEWVEIQPMNSRVVRCTAPWVPTYVNGGHECAFVLCDNHVLDPLLVPFQPWADRHVGQRNLSVLPAVAGSFRLWAPMGTARAGAEVRILALRAILPDGFPRAENAYATVNQALQQVLMGLRGAKNLNVAGLNRGEATKPTVFAERISPDYALRSTKTLDETKRIENVNRDKAPNEAVTGADLGDLVLRLDRNPSVAVLLNLELNELALRINELVVLIITHLDEGVVTGGYTLSLVNPAWFKDSPLMKGGRFMSEQKKDLEELDRSTDTAEGPAGANVKSGGFTAGSLGAIPVTEEQAEGHPSIPSGRFEGPSIYGSTAAKGEK